ARPQSLRCPRAFTRSRPRSGPCSSTRPRSRWRRRSRFRCSSRPRCSCSFRSSSSGGAATPRSAARAERGDGSRSGPGACRRSPAPGHRLLALLSRAPAVIPGFVLAVARSVASTRPPLVLYGSLWILFVAYLTKEMPVGYSQSDATFKGVHPELEEAGRILGAGRLRVLGEITAPLARSGIIATWCFVFIGVIRELPASIILFPPNTKVISV